jgi:hypothetical protein
MQALFQAKDRVRRESGTEFTPPDEPLPPGKPVAPEDLEQPASAAKPADSTTKALLARKNKMKDKP